jgi:ketosteroid isomerase-like protein
MTKQDLRTLTFYSVLATFSLLQPSMRTSAQSTRDSRSHTVDVEQEIRALEQERLGLFYERDVGLLDRLFADDVVIIAYDPPVVLTKKEFIERFKSRNFTVRRVSQDISQVRVYGDTAIVNGTMSIERKEADGRDTRFSTINTHVWLKREGQWKLVSVHRSPIEFQGKPVAAPTR